MIYHLVVDDKFIDMALREFEAVAQGQNQAIILGEPRDLKYVKNTHVVFMNAARLKQAFRSGDCQAVIFHTLHEWSLPLLAAVPEGKPTFWLGWGFDYYGRLLSDAYPNGLLLPRTAALREQLRVEGLSFKRLPVKLVNRLRSSLAKLLGRSIAFSPNSLNRLDYFIPIIEPEYTLARSLNPWFRAEYVCWNYGTVEDDMSNGTMVTSSGRDVLIGNSASFENNHLELFELLAENFDLEGRKLVTPLSYGNPWYAEKVIAEGTRLFGDQFVPLTDFLPKEQYIEILDSCGHVFMNHLRQQALGNICIMMLKGAKIYLNAINPLYAWLTGQGAFIDSIDDVNSDSPGKLQTLHPLSDTKRQANRQVIMNHWGRGAQRARTRRLVDVALQLKGC